MKIELTCTKCGNNRFAYPERGGDEGIVTCEICTHVIGTLSEVQDAVTAAVLSGSGVASPTRRS